LLLSIVQGFFISIGGICLSVLFAYFEEKKYGVNLSAELQKEIDRVIPHTTDGVLPTRRVVEFIILFFSLFGTVLVINGLVVWDLLMIILFVILIWTFSYFVIKRKVHTLIQKSKQYLTQGITKKSQEFSILFSAGLLIYSLNVSGLGDLIP
jgi:Ca2+/Na+ antiporter